MSPQRGGWEAVSRMFQPVLGDETPEDCDSWKADELTVAFIAVGYVLLEVLDRFGIVRVFQ